MSSDNNRTSPVRSRCSCWIFPSNRLRSVLRWLAGSDGGHVATSELDPNRTLVLAGQRPTMLL
jgi:hypothetical protein